MTRNDRKARNDEMVREMTRRLVALHADLTPSDLSDGQAWYDRARRAAQDMAVGGDVVRAASVIAHLSPRTHWASNVAWAAKLLEAARAGASCPPVSTTGQRRKAWAVATGTADPAADHGPKTSAFMANILGEVGRVCVDLWAVRAATGEMEHDASFTSVFYALVERAYQAAAAIVGMVPRDLQAAVWIHVRGSAA